MSQIIVIVSIDTCLNRNKHTTQKNRNPFGPENSSRRAQINP